MIAGTPDTLLLDPYASGYLAVWDDSCMLAIGPPGAWENPFNTDNMRTFVLRGGARLSSRWLVTIDYSAFTDFDTNKVQDDQPGASRADEVRLSGFYRWAPRCWVGLGLAGTGPFGSSGVQSCWHGLLGIAPITPAYQPEGRRWSPVLTTQVERDGWFAAGAVTAWSTQAAVGKLWRPTEGWWLGLRGEVHYVVADAPAAVRFGEKAETGVWGSATYCWDNLFLSVEFNPVMLRADMTLGWRF